MRRILLPGRGGRGRLLGSRRLDYHASMPVSPNNAYRLLKAFGMLEFQLKRTGDFFQIKTPKPPIWKKLKIGSLEIDVRRSASSPPAPVHMVDVDWNKVDQAVARMGQTFVALVPMPAQRMLLAPPRNRPKRERIEFDQAGRPRAAYQPVNLPHNEAEALVVAMRRVRNNLFHGGKEDPLEETYLGEDDDWAEAASAVAEVLLDLLDHHALRPVHAP